jgi:hypothetical protein
MKKVVLLFSFLFVYLTSISQIIEVEFNNHISFNSGTKHLYDDIIKESNMIFKEFKPSKNNKYVFDLTNKEVKLFYNNTFIEKERITDVKEKGSLIFISINDELLTGEKITSNVVLNLDKKNKLYPEFTFYFIYNGISYGYRTL